jgi:hypothetical protein
MMKRFISKWSVSILCFFSLQVLFAGFLLPQAEAATSDSISSSIEELQAYYSAQGAYNDWEALGLRCTGVAPADKYSVGELSSASDYARSIMGTIAAGDESASGNAYIQQLQSMQSIEGHFNTEENSSLNQTIWAVIALTFAEANNYDVSYNAEAARSYIIGQQDVSGGFDESGWGVDVDSTAHALVALAPDKEAHIAVIDNALSYLKGQQAESGIFTSWGTASPDSTAAVIEAMVALGEDPQNPAGEGWQGNMLDALMEYQLPNGAFFASWAPDEANAMTTGNALLALGDSLNEKSKYLNELDNLNDLSLAVEASDSFSLDSDAAMVLSLGNMGDTLKDVLLIAALFNTENESMINYTYLSRQLQIGETAVLGCGFTIPSSGEYEVRIYTWDNWGNKNPLLSPVSIPVN